MKPSDPIRQDSLSSQPPATEPIKPSQISTLAAASARRPSVGRQTITKHATNSHALVHPMASMSMNNTAPAAAQALGSHARSSSTATTTVRSQNLIIILKKGWIYKKGQHFYSQWHPKWAVLSQELPIGTPIPSSILSLNPSALGAQSNSNSNSSSSSASAFSSVAQMAGSDPSALDYQKAKRVTLHLYDERSHADAKLPPKYSIQLHESDSIEDVTPSSSTVLMKEKRRFVWTICTMDKKYELSTFSASEKSDWIAVLSKTRAHLWFRALEPVPQAATDPKQLEAPSAPLKEAIVEPTTGPPALVIPKVTAPSRSDQGVDFFYEDVPVLEEKDIQYILLNKSSMAALSPSPETLSRWKNEKWYELYQSFYLIDRQGRQSVSYLKFMEKLADFKAAATFYAKKLVDECHTKPVNSDKRMERLSIGELTVKFAAEYRLGTSVDAGEKRLAREINAIQSIHSLAPNMNGLYYKLIWMIDYKGFRIEASVSPPVKSENLVLDLVHSSALIDTNALAKLDTLGKALHLMPYEMDLHGKTLSIGASKYIKMFRDPNVKGIHYAHEMENLLPFDVTTSHDEQARPSIDVQKRLRIEWLNIIPMTISPDAFKDDDANGANVDELSLVEACKDLQEHQVGLLAKKLDRLDMILWHSDVLSEYFHVHGVNLRYLGLVASKATLPHVKEACYIEMAARAFKALYRARLRSAIFHYQEMGATKIQNELYSLTVELYASVLFGKDSPDIQASSGSGKKNAIMTLLKELVKEKFGDAVDIPWRNLHAQALFEAMNHQCAVIWEDNAYDLNLENCAPLRPDNILALGVREKGVIKRPELYPYLRVNEYHGSAGLGLLMNSSVEEDLGVLGSDLFYHSRGAVSSDHSTATAGSPIQNYFGSVLPATDCSLSTEPSYGPGGDRLYSLARLQAPSIPFMAAIHFQSLGPRLKCGSSPISALWLYLLAHHSLFVLEKPADALWQSNVGLALNRSAYRSPVYQQDKASQPPLPSSSQLPDDGSSVECEPSGTGGVLNAQLRLIAMQAKFVISTHANSKQELHRLKAFSAQSPSSDKIQLMMDVAHRELTTSLGANHPLIMRFYQTLAGSFWYLKQFDQCVEYQKRAVEMSLRGLGKTHPWTLRALLLLGSFCLHTGDIEQALHAFRESLQGANYHLKPAHSTLASSASGNSPVSKAVAAASASTMPATMCSIETGAVEPTFIAEVHYALSEAYLIYGDLESALQHAQTSQSMKESILGSDHPVTINSFYQVAEMALTGFGQSMENANGDTGSVGIAMSGSNTHLDRSMFGGDEALSRSPLSVIDMITSKVMTKAMSRNAQLALQCYERIFQFVKYQAATTNKGLAAGNHSPSHMPPPTYAGVASNRYSRANGTIADSPVRWAIYTPVAASPTFSRLARQESQKQSATVPSSPSASSTLWSAATAAHPKLMSEQEAISSQLFELTRKLLWLRVALASPMQRDMLRRVLKKRSDDGATTQPNSLKSIALKLIAYSPVAYLDSLLDKLSNAVSRGDVDANTENELIAAFSLMDMQNLQSAMQ